MKKKTGAVGSSQPLRPRMEVIGPKLKESSSSPSWTKVVPSPAKLSTVVWW